MLNRENLKGFWSGIGLPWREDDTFDEKAFYDNCVKTDEANVPGIYIFGSSGEWYAVSMDEFKNIVDVFSDATKNRRILTQVGCNALYTKEAYKKIDYAANKGTFDGVQISFPSWMRMSDTECREFLEYICDSFPEMSFIHYNIDRTKRKFTGEDYRKLTHIKNLVGTKWTGANYMEFNELMLNAPHLVHFVGEHFIVPGMMTGARGCYSALVNGNPKLMNYLFDLCERKEWEKAMEIQLKINRWFLMLESAFPEKGMDPVGDKATTEIGGFQAANGNVRTRRPYIEFTGEELTRLRKITEDAFPEYIYKP